MADNKNQAQLLEDYGSNVLAGAGGGGGFVVTVTYDDDSSAYVIDKTWEEIQSAYSSGTDFKVKYDEGDGGTIWDCLVGISYYQGSITHVLAESSYGGELNDFDIYDDEGTLTINHTRIEIPS